MKELLEDQNGCVYVSGRAKFMPKSVEKAFKEILGDAEVEKMKKNGRY
jgi:sulfite reductase alpha subunit-like flavoprotein